ncbi:MAG: PLP-dependent aminotransferase family protein [Clostridia bacterium]|nr:PLP-dependent aminotransferase family protein [Clostridia bacterium]
MNYIIDKKSRPVYLELYKQLRDDIIGGAFDYGEKLPSKRLLSEEVGVSTITVEHAYALLCDEGYAEAKERSGYFVSFRSSDGFAVSGKEENDERKKAAFGASENSKKGPSFSVSLLSKTMRKVLTDYGESILKKSPNPGCVELRTALRYYLARNRGIFADIDQIVVGSGAEYLYSMIIDLLGRGKTYAIEFPSYEKIEQIYRASGVKYELLPLSDDGIDGEALSKTKADVLHTTPYRSFPTGVTASATKRHEYIRWAEKGERFIVESDYDSEFSVSSKPAETLFVLSKSENVIYLNTFSKTISPSFRVGYMVLPKRLVEPFNEKLGFYSCTVPTFEQLVLTELLNKGSFERHINRVRRAKRKETLK